MHISTAFLTLKTLPHTYRLVVKWKRVAVTVLLWLLWLPKSTPINFLFLVSALLVTVYIHMLLCNTNTLIVRYINTLCNVCYVYERVLDIMLDGNYNYVVRVRMTKPRK